METGDKDSENAREIVGQVQRRHSGIEIDGVAGESYQSLPIDQSADPEAMIVDSKCYMEGFPEFDADGEVYGIQKKDCAGIGANSQEEDDSCFRNE